MTLPMIDRSPSTTWEAVPLLDEPPRALWVWYRPSTAPDGVFVQIPADVPGQIGRPLTLRRVLQSLKIAPAQVGRWSLYGTAYDSPQGLGLALDAPIPPPSPGHDPSLGIFPGVVPALAPATNIPAGAARVDAGTASALIPRIDAAWNGCLQLETQLLGLVKQVQGTALRINSLNRDLSSEESRFADTQDKREWQDARRWLRDSAARLARAMKDHQLGVTSTAGKRNWFETTHQQCLAGQLAADSLLQADREFEMYRKTLQTLLNTMVAVQGAAVQDGERRAQQILARIAARVRTMRAKR